MIGMFSLVTDVISNAVDDADDADTGFIERSKAGTGCTVSISWRRWKSTIKRGRTKREYEHARIQRDG